MKSTIDKLYAGTYNSISIDYTTGIINVSHYPAASEQWRLTGNTVDDGAGNQVQEVEKIN